MPCALTASLAAGDTTAAAAAAEVILKPHGSCWAVKGAVSEGHGKGLLQDTGESMLALVSLVTLHDAWTQQLQA